MSSKDIDLFIRRHFEGIGWHWESVCGLPAALVMDSVVTPFVSTRTVGRGRGVYMIQGYVGVLHRDFERDWVRMRLSSGEEDQDRKYCCILNTQNIDNIYRHSYIEKNNTDEINNFIENLSSFVRGIPKNISMLKGVFDGGELGGVDLQKFVGYGQRVKFEKFKSFVENFV